jgi:hypothetical protein
LSESKRRDIQTFYLLAAPLHAQLEAERKEWHSLGPAAVDPTALPTWEQQSLPSLRPTEYKEVVEAIETGLFQAFHSIRRREHGESTFAQFTKAWHSFIEYFGLNCWRQIQAIGNAEIRLEIQQIYCKCQRLKFKHRVGFVYPATSTDPDVNEEIKPLYCSTLPADDEEIAEQLRLDAYALAVHKWTEGLALQRADGGPEEGGRLGL